MPTEIQNQAMGYDRAATMFSPEGHLLQVEYAEKTVKLGSSSVGLVCKDGILIVADKRIRDKLIASESAGKIFEIKINGFYIGQMFASRQVCKHFGIKKMHHFWNSKFCFSKNCP